jgi:hypothetical protein
MRNQTSEAQNSFRPIACQRDAGGQVLKDGLGVTPTPGFVRSKTENHGIPQQSPYTNASKHP